MKLTDIVIMCMDGDSGQTLFPYKITYQKNNKIILDFSRDTADINYLIGEKIAKKCKIYGGKK